MNNGYVIDGKPVRKFLFTRWFVTLQAARLYMVEAFNKDHAIARLIENNPGTDSRDFDFIDEVGPEHFIGKAMGETYPLLPHGGLH